MKMYKKTKQVHKKKKQTKTTQFTFGKIAMFHMQAVGGDKSPD